MKWTPEQDAEILRRRASGESPSQTARAMGKTKNAVVGRLGRLGATGYTPEQRVYDRTKEYLRRKFSTVERGDWDVKTFEPYEIRKARRRMEAENGLGN